MKQKGQIAIFVGDIDIQQGVHVLLLLGGIFS